MIRALAESGATVLFSTHVMQHAERLCDKVVLLARGRKAFEGTVDEARATSPRFLELEGALDRNAVAALPGVSGIETLAEDGAVSTLRVGLTPGAEAQSALRAAFLGGLDVRRFQMKEPTLHDAFIALTGDHPDEDQSVDKADTMEAAR
jgi:ABC-2 type transport system ATP-binding protein